ncbi:unnamed protein product (macronuclear) [Paramecium tetraurelia]|uniref:Phosphoglucomutase-1 n=1 Tax=Paramecium tetraurelia TaxID=5888 RepID=PGM1_PARTE|nr:uncharacterized protein GSPATT00032405001 [Paramecium tetraurelia]P47244.4 RecName: Full=Phosphoglucomutase-1; Short=PGM 1; AltName: Full=Glucose phosphomutase 1; AltName: Full=Parafusin; Short=Pf; AltName: Full=pp63 [Paramecium tetraurelia]1KFI_A Chain A, phosphoglucomutase 1 [Paramecium tetraurelia]1KFI_B Chain B, phosphoglucomutase 1 [Paramecium tetraurelia]1KFQ_A Chain A, phosphoglucomutase 1 [Paramecium tetraurelia]1KFQ_B Chain B, phosphoglucomutase 1 [Paramecium tetraurelia]CAA71088.|eukprot:XP_001429571.1 hypothetical protein (macronuclear) [Paramecium tetraurelia strain d4-2]
MQQVIPAPRVQVTQPYAGQKPGTSGLRKKVSEATQPNYLENFVQSIFNTLRKDELKPKNVLFVGGDGRYFNRQAIFSIIRLAYANDISEVHVGQAGLMSTPASSHYIRKVNEEVGNCIGGIILTASHNPGGKEHGDFGIKFNVRTGAPAPEDFTDQIYTHTTKIKEYLTVDYEFEKHINLDQIGVYKFEGTRLEKSHFEVKVVDTVQDYTQLMQKLFDFDLLKGLFSNKDFSFRFDGMHGVAGPYAKHIFGTLLGCSKESLLNCDPSEDFGGGHPDPNLTYAHDLVELLDIHKKKDVGTVPQFGAACDGDADRNMILGRQFFVTPSDSLAVIAANANLIFKNGLLGAARSMPTSGALDKVAAKNGIKLFETPTGWKFFGNLMDAGLINLCGEESFGTGSNHIREKDGIWAVLAWLTILAHKNKNTDHFVTVEEIVTQYWQQFGRNYYSRYDYEQVDSAGANKMMEHLKTKFQYFEQLKQGNKADIYDYVDPVDQSVSKNQGVRFVFGDGSRIIFRLSGTGSVGATIRIYFEQFEQQQIQHETATALANIIKLGLEISDIAQFTGRNEPTVIT